MRVTIIPEDNLVLINGKPTYMDVSSYVDSKIHAIQWYEDHGEIEFKDGSHNEQIESIVKYNRLILEATNLYNSETSQVDVDTAPKTLQEAKLLKIQEIKGIASNMITSIASIPEQSNMHNRRYTLLYKTVNRQKLTPAETRELLDINRKFDQIESIRKASNTIEKMVNTLKSATRIQEYPVSNNQLWPKL